MGIGCDTFPDIYILEDSVGDDWKYLPVEKHFWNTNIITSYSDCVPSK